uniref:Putative LAGLIDADG homing endonuclease n=1 Tax=Rhexinema sarcinoideum TaxID=43261 RepID=A0A1B2RYW0_9CHLO|nr:putative LAGLIDADG homing endonuclease [Rhexinema sarcinoideum]
MNTQVLCFPFLAGLFDGDGSIRVYKSTGEYVVTMHQEDLALLEQLKNQFEGAIRKVANKKAIRWILNLKNAKNGRQTLIELTQGLNGHICNSVRIEQFKQLCQAFGFPFKAPEKLTNQNGYIAGLFCSDGTIFMNARPSAAAKKLKLAEKETALKAATPTLTSSFVEVQNGEALKEKSIQRVLKGVAPVIEVRIANQFLINVENLPASLGFGVCYFNKKGKNPRGHFTFHVKSEKDILKFNTYMQKYKNASVKYHRLCLVETFYKLRKEGAHLANACQFQKNQWENLIRQWYNPSFACKQSQKC